MATKSIKSRSGNLETISRGTHSLASNTLNGHKQNNKLKIGSTAHWKGKTVVQDKDCYRMSDLMIVFGTLDFINSI